MDMSDRAQAGAKDADLPAHHQSQIQLLQLFIPIYGQDFTGIIKVRDLILDLVGVKNDLGHEIKIFHLDNGKDAGMNAISCLGG